MGYRVQVIDFYATRRVFHRSYELPAALGREPKAWREGRPKIERDFLFHAQAIHALVMKTLARFEFALGRRIRGRSRRTSSKWRRTAWPTPMRSAVQVEGLVFGYFDGLSGRKYSPA